MDVRIWRVSFFGAVFLTYRYVRLRTAGSHVCFENRSGGRTPRTARRGWATRRLSARFDQRHPRPLWQTCLSLSSTGPATARSALPLDPQSPRQNRLGNLFQPGCSAQGPKRGRPVSPLPAALWSTACQQRKDLPAAARRGTRFLSNTAWKKRPRPSGNKSARRQTSCQDVLGSSNVEKPG